MKLGWDKDNHKIAKEVLFGLTGKDSLHKLSDEELRGFWHFIVEQIAISGDK